MLQSFLVSHRDAIISRARARVSGRTSPRASDGELTNGIPVFLDQLGEALLLAESTSVVDHAAIGRSARAHGRDLLRIGLTIAQVVHDYGDICQVITELCVECQAVVSGKEFRILNLCLDDAIAAAVTEYARQREKTIADEGNERLGVLAHEMRNHLNSAMLSFDLIKKGTVAPGGSTGMVHTRALLGLRDLIDRSLASVRLDAGLGRSAPISVAAFIEEIQVGALMEAQARGLRFEVTPVDPTVTIEGDRAVLIAAVANLVQNAFKFTRPASQVLLSTRVTRDHVLLDVADECGGLPPGKAEELFQPFEQRGEDRSGLGLGLFICRKAALASSGALRVRDIPGTGCVFTLELPRRAPPLGIVGGRTSTEGGSSARGDAQGGDGKGPKARLDVRRGGVG